MMNGSTPKEVLKVMLYIVVFNILGESYILKGVYCDIKHSQYLIYKNIKKEITRISDQTS